MPTPASPAATLSPGELVAQHPVTMYTLTSDQLVKSERLHRIGVTLSFSSTALSLAVLITLIVGRFAPKLQRALESFTKNRLAQAILFVPTILLTVGLFELPLEIYGHHVSQAYGLSVQSWTFWLTDWAKASLLTLLLASLVTWGLYAIIRYSPRHWWFYAWLVTLPIMAGMVFAAPVIIDPLFDRFEPLAKTNPELTLQLRNLAQSAGLQIPESRIFLMHASDKVTTYNAYVTGFGATKRIVVWDTTARDLTLPQTLFVFGHEMGHYVLHHIYLGLACGAVLTFVGLWLTQHLANAVCTRFGNRWQIRSLGDWSSLPLLLFLATLLTFFGEPLANTFSRWEEHQADVYGLAVTRPLSNNSAQIATQAFQVLGEKSYSYPSPSPLLVFWSYSHPPISDRIRFVLSGDAAIHSASNARQ